MALENTHFGYEKINAIIGDGKKNIFFSGIGGISMNSLAAVCHTRGHVVTGYDRVPSPITASLEAQGVKIFYESSADLVENVDVYVYTVAMPQDDPAYVRAGELGIPRISRSDFLGYIMKGYKSRVGVSGMHGKSTTTALVSSVYTSAGRVPTVFGGAVIKEAGASNILGNDEAFIFEACEYMDSFLDFYPSLAIVLNVEMDHVDYFHSMDHIRSSFAAFMSKADVAVVNADDEDAMCSASKADSKIVTFGGEGSGADYTSANVKFTHGYAEFDIICRGEHLCHVKMNVPGRHLVIDALAAATAAHTDGISGEDIAAGLAGYSGICRRMENKGKSAVGADVYDDYAHHPTEIKATLTSAAEMEYDHTYCVFQPHTFSRTAELLEGFADALGCSDVDEVILAQIYPAREVNTYGISSAKLGEEILKRGKKCVVFDTFEEIADYLNEKLTEGDAAFIVGAGDVNKVSDMLVR